MSNPQQSLLDLIRQHYQTEEFIPLHAPCFDQQEKQLLNECIDSTFVSTVGKFVDEFEQKVAAYTGAKYAIAVTNGTLGLFLALKTVGVQANDLVITQSLTFVATANAISMLGAKPLFLDVSENTLGLSAKELATFLTTETFQKNGETYHTKTQQKIAACVPMHSLGFSAEIDKIVSLCRQYNLKVVEDAAESLGSFYQNQHTGTFGDIGVFSFNGNKILTTGGGGMLITNNEALAKKAKHLSTTAKVPHQWLFEHDEIAYNLRLPNLNAALGVAQMNKLNSFLIEKRLLAKKYHIFASKTLKSPGVPPPILFKRPKNQQPNNWLNAFIFENQQQRDNFLALSNEQGIQTRPLWTPMHKLAIYKDTICASMPVTEYMAERLVTIPSGVNCESRKRDE